MRQAETVHRAWSSGADMTGEAGRGESEYWRAHAACDAATVPKRIEELGSGCMLARRARRRPPRRDEEGRHPRLPGRKLRVRWVGGGPRV